MIHSMFSPAPASLLGNKFANLRRAAEVVSVPTALCLSVDAFAKALGAGRQAYLEAFFADLKATVGCFLVQTIPDLNGQMAGLCVPEDLRTALHAHLLETFGSLEGRSFAVRSSGATEDSESASFAGVYRSTLNVQGIDGICEAIAECWKTYYSYPAVTARVRAGQYQPDPGMAVIIQEMVAPELAGVVFTSAEHPGGALAEYVRGLGDALVSGAVSAERYHPGDGVSRSAADRERLAEVCRTAQHLSRVFGFDVDVEWAWGAQGLRVLQVRPVTAGLKQGASREPLFLTAPLYLSKTLPPGMDLGECRDVYTTYVTKRSGAHRLALQVGVATGAAHLLTFNGAGLLGNTSRLEQLLASNSSPRVVLDISSNIRQVILNKTDVLNYLATTFALSATSLAPHTVIIRDFIRGQYGFISRLTGEDGLMVEYSTDGLMNINRGIAHCERIVVPRLSEPPEGDNLVCDGDEAALSAFRAVLPQIQLFTKELNRELPGTQLEWVLDAGVPYFVDFSRERDDVQYTAQEGCVTIASGVARGPVLRLTADEMLSRLSIGPAVSVDRYDAVLEHDGLRALTNLVTAYAEKPILFVQKPYAILSTLIDHAAGFVFAEGSLLCHLGILLREQHIPSVICQSAASLEGVEALIANGSLTILHRGEALL